jgi:hypothetical protein
MTRETLAEILCNLAGADPNNEQAWQEHLAEADQQLAAAAAGEISPWWQPEEQH